MAVIPVVPNRGRIEESNQQLTLTAATDIAQHTAVSLNTNGRLVAGGTPLLGVTTRSVRAGDSTTVIRRGVIDGLDLDGLAYGDPVYATPAGVLDTTATSNTRVGMVVAVNTKGIGFAPDKLLLVEVN